MGKVRLSHWHSQRARAHVHATPSLCSQERAHRFGTRAVALARHPLAPPNRRMPRCTMTSVPATTLATADEVELRKVTQRSTIGASSRSSPQAVLFTRRLRCPLYSASRRLLSVSHDAACGMPQQTETKSEEGFQYRVLVFETVNYVTLPVSYDARVPVTSSGVI